MKYTRLTKEQLEELHVEFANFLASQQIDKEEWEDLKKNKPEVAEEELNVFSDLVWEGALTAARYMEHFSKNHIFLFRFDETSIDTVVLKTENTSVDFLKKEGLEWLSENMFSPEVEIRKGAKTFGEDRNGELFEIIRQGAFFSNGELYHQIADLMK
ncbi:DUF6495 family protein [Capnocytophaga sp. ARDL2]|uniref:DUF6495 family protein n=1 Tax=Capnocytophaga sp. ARDL2 TaxID=3238809 RepID=UPI0035577AE3